MCCLQLVFYAFYLLETLRSSFTRDVQLVNILTVFITPNVQVKD